MSIQPHEIEIDFRPIGAKVYVGRPNGRQAREYFKIEETERLYDKFTVNVFFPENTKTLTSSFFLGMFGDSVIKKGSRESFLESFKFHCSPDVKKQIDQSIAEALSSSFGD